MALVLRARVEVTATVDGLGNVTNMSANNSRIDFSFLPDSDYTYGYIEQDDLWEECTLTMSGGQLVRSQQTASSSGGSAVAFDGANSCTVFVDIPLDKMPIEAADGTYQNSDALLKTVALPTIASLKAVQNPSSSGIARYVLGATSYDDGFGAWYYWDGTNTDANDDNDVVESGFTGTGRWLKHRPQLQPVNEDNDSDLRSGAVARVNGDLKSSHVSRGKVLQIPEVHSIAVQASFPTVAAFKAEPSSSWVEGDQIELRGLVFENDLPVPLRGYWNASSTNTDALDYLYYRPDDITDVSPGRLFIPTPDAVWTFADDDVSPDVSAGDVFQVADSAPAEIITFDKMRPRQKILVMPNASSTQVFKHNSSTPILKFDLPSDTDFTLSPGDAPIIFQRIATKILIIGGGGAGASSFEFFDEVVADGTPGPYTIKTDFSLLSGETEDGLARTAFVEVGYSTRQRPTTDFEFSVSGSNLQITFTENVDSGLTISGFLIRGGLVTAEANASTAITMTGGQTLQEWRNTFTSLGASLVQAADQAAAQTALDVPSTSAMSSAISTALAGFVDTAPSTLDTLNELAAALGDDPNYAATVSTQIGTINTTLGGKLDTSGGTLTGDLILAKASGHTTLQVRTIAGGGIIYGQASDGKLRIGAVNASGTFLDSHVDFQQDGNTYFYNAIATVGAASGFQADGTISAVALYDNSGVLSCYPFDQYLDGKIDIGKWDAKVPDINYPDEIKPIFDESGVQVGEEVVKEAYTEARTHFGARKFAERIGTEYDPLTLEGYAKHWKEKRHLTAMPNEETYDIDKPMSHGSWIQRLIETVEVQAIHIETLNQRTKQISSELQALFQGAAEKDAD